MPWLAKWLPLGKRPIHCSQSQITYISLLPDTQKISQTSTDRDINKYVSRFLDDIKVFEPNDEGDLTVQVAAQCYRSKKKNDAPHGLLFFRLT